MRALAYALALAAPASALAAETGALVRFVTCPVYRDADSGKKSGCWLADDPASGIRWDISQSPYKPDWNHAVLVEGRVAADGGNPCGGAVLEPVRSSRLLTSDCARHMLPAEGYSGRRYKLQGRYIDPLSVPRKAPEGPFKATMFPVYFEFGNDFMVYQYDDYLIDKAVTWMLAAKPKRVVVTGFAATKPEVVSGVTLAEPASLAKDRALRIAETMQRLIPGLVVETKWQTGAGVTDEPEADGIPGQSQRRVEMRAEF